jgi:hypothetical protein
MNPASNNPPVTAATITAAVLAVLAAFTDLSADQVAAVGACVGIVASLVAQRFTRPTGGE